MFDLNRNFLGPDEKFAGASEMNFNLDAFLNPPSPPAPDLFYFRAAWLAARYGIRLFGRRFQGANMKSAKGSLRISQTTHCLSVLSALGLPPRA